MRYLAGGRLHILFVYGDSKQPEGSLSKSTGAEVTEVQFVWSVTKEFVWSVTKEFVGPFEKQRKATISFVMSARTEQLGSHWKDSH